MVMVLDGLPRCFPRIFSIKPYFVPEYLLAIRYFKHGVCNMGMAYLRFFWYILRHKWHVLRACLMLDVSLRQALLHDWTKLLPPERLPYAQFFYVYGTPAQCPYGPLRYLDGFAERIEWAKDLHQCRNPHHWQYWVCSSNGNGSAQQAMAMPECYAREMVADWIGAGIAQGKPDTYAWFEENKATIILHPETYRLVEDLLHEARRKKIIP
jgi:hypothetical protein